MKLDINKLKGIRIEHLKPKNTIDVTEFEKLRQDNKLIIFDARSEGEFEEYHIVGSYNIPLLNNEARKVVGTIYKNQNQEKAIDAGWNYFEDTVEKIVSQVNKVLDNLVNKNKQIVVYCARGGMRSRIVTNLIEYFGHKVYQLDGGIKVYRNFLYSELDKLSDNFNGKFIVLEGQTGTQKTLVLEKYDLAKIDLEDLAQHRASTYGAVNLIPRSHKMFTFLLYEEFRKIYSEKYIVIEGESRRIGNVFIPDKFFVHMNVGIFVFVTASIETRVKNIFNAYFSNEESVQNVIEVTPKLTKYLGKKRITWLIEQFNSDNKSEAIKFLLLDYYDKVYKSLNPSPEYALDICTDDLDSSIKMLKKFVLSLK